MTPRLAIILLLVFVAVPAAHAAESATPKNAAQWCTAWKNGSELAEFATLYPGGLGFAKTFEQTKGNGRRQEEPSRQVRLPDGAEARGGQGGSRP